MCVEFYSDAGIYYYCLTSLVLVVI